MKTFADLEKGDKVGIIHYDENSNNVHDAWVDYAWMTSSNKWRVEISENGPGDPYIFEFDGKEDAQDDVIFVSRYLEICTTRELADKIFNNAD